MRGDRSGDQVVVRVADDREAKLRARKRSQRGLELLDEAGWFAGEENSLFSLSARQRTVFFTAITSPRLDLQDGLVIPGMVDAAVVPSTEFRRASTDIGNQALIPAVRFRHVVRKDRANSPFSRRGAIGANVP